MKEAAHFSHLTLRDRIKIQIGLETGQTIQEIAMTTKFSRQKIYCEFLTVFDRIVIFLACRKGSADNKLDNK